MSERVNNNENNSKFYWEWTYNDTMLWKQMFINAHDVYEMNYNNNKKQQQIIH